MGLPVGYTRPCLPKRLHGSIEHQDTRHILVGNSWSVPVVASLIAQLCGPLGLCPAYTPQQIVDFLDPERQVFLPTRLWRTPFAPNAGGRHPRQPMHWFQN